MLPELSEESDGAVLAIVGVVDVVEEHALLGDGDLRPTVHLFELDGGDAERGPLVAVLHVVGVDDPFVVDDVATAPVGALGPAVEHHARFPRRANVGFMAVRSRAAIDLRVFERGAGETLACGTGACAAVVSGRLRGLLDERVEVRLPGGTLVVSWAGDEQPVWMTGPAATVFDGTLDPAILAPR